MLLDKQNMFLNSVNVNGLAASAPVADPSAAVNFGAAIAANLAVTPGGSQGSIDLGNPNTGAFPSSVQNQVRRTTGLTVFAMVSGAAFTGLTALTVDIFNTDVPGVVAAMPLVASSGALTVSATVLNPGYEIPIEIPDSVKLARRYLACRVTTTGPCTSNTILDIGLVPDGDRQTSQV